MLWESNGVLSLGPFWATADWFRELLHSLLDTVPVLRQNHPEALVQYPKLPEIFGQHPLSADVLTGLSEQSSRDETLGIK